MDQETQEVIAMSCAAVFVVTIIGMFVLFPVLVYLAIQ